MKDEYARVGVPMMPVVHGEKETRRQIVLYTILLGALTLLPVVFGFFGCALRRRRARPRRRVPRARAAPAAPRRPRQRPAHLPLLARLPRGAVRRDGARRARLLRLGEVQLRLGRRPGSRPRRQSLARFPPYGCKTRHGTANTAGSLAPHPAAVDVAGSPAARGTARRQPKRRRCPCRAAPSTRSASCWAGDAGLDRHRVVGGHAVGRDHDRVARLERDRAHRGPAAGCSRPPRRGRPASRSGRSAPSPARMNRASTLPTPVHAHRPRLEVEPRERHDRAARAPELLVAALEQLLRRERRRAACRTRRPPRTASAAASPWPRPSITATSPPLGRVRRPRGRRSDPLLRAPAPPRRARVPAAMFRVMPRVRSAAPTSRA